MTGWVILCIVLALLAVLLLIPVQVRVSYGQGVLLAKVRYGLIRFQLYPPVEQLKDGPKEKKERKKKNKKKDKKKNEESKKQKPNIRINWEQICYSLETLPPIAFKALKRVRQRIRIDPLKIYLLVVGIDPADTALLYGKLTAALSAGLPILQRLVRIRNQDIRLLPDFVGEQTAFMADVGIAIRPWDALKIGICAGASLLKWLLGYKKLASPPEEQENGTNENTEENTKENNGESETTAA